MDGIYGTVEPSQTLLAQFYSAQQKDDEDVATWACRLEDILDRASKQRRISRDNADEMLRNKLWAGLKPTLNDASRHKYDSVTTFDNLVIELRKIELEHRQRSTSTEEKKLKTHSKAATSSDSKPKQDEIQDLKGMIQSLATTVKSLQDNINKPQQGNNSNNSGGGRRYNGPRRQQNNNTAQQQGNQPTNQQQRQPQQSRSGFNSNPQNQNREGSGGGCWRCGGLDHYKIGCRARIDHSNTNSLNSQAPTTPGQE